MALESYTRWLDQQLQEKKKILASLTQALNQDNQPLAMTSSADGALRTATLIHAKHIIGMRQTVQQELQALAQKQLQVHRYQLRQTQRLLEEEANRE